MMSFHKPVLLKESIDGLDIKPDGIYVDLTFGGGGHSAELLKRLGKGRLIAVDQDEDARQNMKADPRILFVHSNFRYIENFLRYNGIKAIDGALADLGISSHHLDDEGRGFSFRNDQVLDMRMNQKASVSARQILNECSQEELIRIFRQNGEIKNAGSLAKLICNGRKSAPIIRVKEFLALIDSCIPDKNSQKYLARVFQAIRIEVNDELGALKEMMEQVCRKLKPGGRFAILTYHSLEDRLVKNYFRSGNFNGTIQKDFYGNPLSPFRLVNRNIIVPSEDEMQENSRARSAKLRIAEKIAETE